MLLMFDLKKIQRDLEGVYGVKFVDSLYLEKPSIKIENKIFTLDIHLGRFKVGDCAEYIAFDFLNKKKQSGLGIPCKSFDEVCHYMEYVGFEKKGEITHGSVQLSLF